MNKRNDAGARVARGWLATLIGGALGAVVLGFVGLMASTAYADTYQNEGFEGLGTMIVGTLFAAWVGAALGAGLMLRAFHHDRPWASGFAFAILGVIVITIMSTLGQMIVPRPLHDTLGAVTLAVLAPVTAALLARMTLSREGGDG